MVSLQKNTSKSVEELTRALVTLTDASKGEILTSELKDWIYMLKVHRLRHCSDAHEFCSNGGVEALLKLLCRCSVNRESRDLVLLLGALGNVCALDKNCRTVVMANALLEIVTILQNSNSSDILNTASRVLANLAVDEEHIQSILQQGVMPHLCQILTRDRHLVNTGCRRSLLRAIRVFSKSAEFREDLKTCEGMHPIVDCLKSEEEELALAAIQTLEVVTQYPDLDLIQPLCNKLSMQSVVRYCNHAKKSVRKSSMNVLLNCAKSSDGRIALSSAGGVETLVAYMESSSRDLSVFNEVVRAVCICCRDVPSRQRLRDCGGLERLIRLLLNEEHASLHSSVMSALVCYYFDENTLKFMVKRLGLLKALTFHLQEMTKRSLTTDSSMTMDEAAESSDEEEEEDDKMQASEESVSSHVSPSPEEDTTETMECSEEKDDQTDDACSSSSKSSLAFGTSSQASTSNPVPKASRKRTVNESSKLTLQGEQEHDSMYSHFEALCHESQNDSNDIDETPPPAKKCRLQIDLDSSPMPANFIDSLLSSPNPYQNQPKPLESSFLSEFSSHLDKQTILMLSRVSHLRDCLTSLASSDILLAMLSYFMSSHPPNVHVFKVLTRIFMNPHCFQDCLTNLVPSRIYEFLRQPDQEGTNPPTPTQIQIPSSPLLSPSSDRLPAFRSMCNELLDRLSKIAESPYGQGVLAHSLLRGEEKEKQASCLTLPLLCRSPRMCQRMMLGYGGFKMLLDLAGDEESSQLQAMALDSLLVLAHTMQKKSGRFPYKRRHSGMQREDSDTQPFFQLCRLDSSLDNLSLSEDTFTRDICNSQALDGISYCRHLDTDHYPFDMTITACSESGDKLTVPVHKSILVETSDVFSVMLAGQYIESESSEVLIQDIYPLSFLSLVHHIYGCGWRCETVMKKVCKSKSCVQTTEPAYSSTTYLPSFTTNALISEIVVHIVKEEEKKKAEHCLQVLACAGRFLLNDLATLCEHAAVSYLQPDNMVLMFQFARLHQCYCLSESCVRAIVSLPHSALRTDVFKDLIQSPEGDAAIEIIMLFLTVADWCS